MDYEKKYKEALDRARTFSQRWQGIEATDSELALQELKEIFPELKMSDDERMIRTLREGFNILDKDDEWYSGITNGQILAWLEKQGEQKSTTGMSYREIFPKFSVGDTLYRHGWANQTVKKVYIDNINTTYICENDEGLESHIDFSEQDEWSKIELSPVKVESKFKAGNWYLCVKDFFGKCVRFEKGHAYYCGVNGYLQQFEAGLHVAIVKKLYDYFNLWTIKDAKDGDVLSFNDGHGNDCIELIKSITDKKIEFWFCLTNGNRYEVFDGIVPYTNLISREDATPATKEQRDLLFQKIKEAGYEWDAEKKELTKIEQKTAEWSEEDEKERKRVVGLLEGWLYTFKETCYAEDCKCGISWLKSLKRTVKIN